VKANTVDAIKLSPEEQAFLRVMIIRQHEKGKTPNEIMDILDLWWRNKFCEIRHKSHTPLVTIMNAILQ
jgi:hypothetical protein